MDASEHETPSMSRHNRRVPTSFFHRFARDACALSDRYAGGRLISVLEGGYSDRALTSGSMAHLSGLVDCPVDEEWWNAENLVMVIFLIISVLVSAFSPIYLHAARKSDEETPRGQAVTPTIECPPAMARARGDDICVPGCQRDTDAFGGAACTPAADLDDFARS